jgi:hypothetical protein
MSGGLSVIGAILAVIGTGVVTAAFLAAFFWLTDKLESTVNERAFRKAIDEALGDDTYGDWTAVPRDFHVNGDKQ